MLPSVLAVNLNGYSEKVASSLWSITLTNLKIVICIIIVFIVFTVLLYDLFRYLDMSFQYLDLSL